MIITNEAEMPDLTVFSGDFMDRERGMCYHKHKNERIYTMRRINIFLSVVLVILIAAGAYFMLGTKMDVQAAARMEDGKVVCDVTLTNRSLFDFECVEFIAVNPEDARIVESAGAGEDVPARSQRGMSFVLESENPAGAQAEIGYYVLGTRKTVTVTMK